MYNRRYHKSYWMMQQETTGYALGQETPWGSCVMEIKNGKGRLTVTAEELLPLRKGYYSVYIALAAKEKEQSVFCHKLIPDRNGHGMIQWDFSPDHLAEGYLVEDIFAVVILAEETGQRGLVAPLAAYCEEKQNWRTAFLRKNIISKQMLEKEKSDDTIQLKIAESICPVKDCIEEKEVENPLQNMETASDVDFKQTEKTMQEPPLLEKGMHGNFRGLLQKFRQEMNQLEEMGILTAEESRRIQGISKPQTSTVTEASIQEISESQTDIEHEKEMQKESESSMDAQNREILMKTRQKSITEKTNIEARIQLAKENISLDNQKETKHYPKEEQDKEAELFADCPAIYPFENGEKWMCVQPEEMLLLEEFAPHWQHDFFYLLPWHRDKHFIVRQEGKSIFLGIPDTYSPAEQKRAEEHGFFVFCPIEGKEDLGYWIGKIQG